MNKCESESDNTTAERTVTAGGKLQAIVGLILETFLTRPDKLSEIRTQSFLLQWRKKLKGRN